jgi:hypothetical protein
MTPRQVAAGRLRVDRGRALEKMRRYQLEDPFRFGVELVAAAVAAGAPRVEVENDADDLWLRWTGALPTRDELDGLFDHLFHRSGDPRTRMLSHLATGVLGALGLSPWVLRIERAAVGDEPALRLEISDPAETRCVELVGEAPEGMLVHVRERPGPAVLRDMVDVVLGRLPVEGRHVAAAARWCRVPVEVNGRAVGATAPWGDTLASAVFDEGGRRGALWLVPGPAVVELVRDGVIVGRTTLKRLGDELGVAGFVEDSALQLNASRSEVVQDDAFAAVADTLTRWRLRLLRDGLDLSAAAWASVARRALAEVPADALGGLAVLAVLRDVSGREWSVEQLRAVGQPPGFLTAAVSGAVSLPNAPLFGPEEAALVRAVFPGAIDRTGEERARLAGRVRRAQAAAEPLAPRFGTVGERVFEAGPLRGAVRLVAPGTGAAGSIRALVRVGGLQVAEVRLEGPAGECDAILDHPGFRTDDRFERVIEDEVWASAVATLRAEARAKVLEVLSAGPSSLAPGPQLLTGFLRGLVVGRSLYGVVSELPEAVTHAPWLMTGAGATSLAAVALGDTPWLVASDGIVPPSIAPRLLVLPVGLAATWRAWLGAPSEAAVAAAVERARREAAPRQEARLTRRPADFVEVRTALVHGELGYTPDQDGIIRLLRGGVMVTDLHLPLRLAKVTGVIDWPTVEVDDAGAKVRDPHDLLRLVTELTPAVDVLAEAAWKRRQGAPDGPLSKPIATWLSVLGVSRWTPSLRGLPVGRSASGGPLTLGELADRGVGRGKVRALSQAPPPDVDFGDAVVLGPVALELANEVFPGRFADATAELSAVIAARNAVLARPLAESPPALARSVLELGDGARLELRLPASPETIGRAVVEARWQGRTLQTRVLGPPGAHVVLEGDGVVPDGRFTGVRDPGLLRRAEREALRGLVKLGLEAAARYQRREAPAWLALRSRLARGLRELEPLAAAIDALPLLRRIDGEDVTIAHVAVAASGGAPIVVVAPSVGPGLAEHAWTIVGLEAGGALQEVLGRGIEDGTEALLRWRSGRERLARAKRVSLTVPGAVFARRALAGPRVVGEVAALMDGPPGIRVTPTVDGVALAPWLQPFPLPAAAVIGGVGLRADADGAKVVEGASTTEAREAVAAAMSELVREVYTQRPASARSWLQRVALGGEASLADAALFPCLGGGFVSAAALLRRRGGVGVVRVATGSLPGDDPPVVDPDGQVAASLRARGVAVHSLDAVVERHTTGVLPPTVPWPAAPVGGPRRGMVGMGRGGVQLRLGRAPVEVVDVKGPVGLVGWVEDPALRPKPDWSGMVDDAARQAVVDELDRLSREVVRSLLARFKPGSDDAPRLRRALEALAPSPLDTRGDDELLAALAAAPLYEDGEGRWGSLADVRAGGLVRAIDARTTGRPAPGASRFWRLPEADRTWLARGHKVVESTAEAVEETKGWTRRDGPAWPRPTPPEGAVALTGAGVAGAVWPGEGGVTVLVDGRRLQAHPAPGLTGWVEGPFEVDAGFRIAELPSAVRKQIDRAAKAAAPKPPPKVSRGSVQKRLRDAAMKLGGQDTREVVAEWNRQPPAWLERALAGGEVGATAAGWAAAAAGVSGEEALALVARLAEALATER